MRILLTRPQAAAHSLKEKLESRGHLVALAPVLSIEPVAFSLDPTGLGGVVLTSASAAPALAKADLPAAVPVYAIGGTSAEAARRQGFRNVISGDGDRRRLVALIGERHDPARGRLLHLSGSHRAGDIVAELGALGLAVERVRVYEAVAAASLPADIIGALAHGEIDIVLFFSPRSAETFVSLIRSAGLGDALSGTVALCLSDVVADAAAAEKWKALAVAVAPGEEAMIAALDGLARKKD